MEDLYKILASFLHDGGYKVSLGRNIDGSCCIVVRLSQVKVWISRCKLTSNKIGAWVEPICSSVNIDVGPSIQIRGKKSIYRKDGMTWHELGDIHNPKLIPNLIKVLKNCENVPQDGCSL